MSDLSGGALEQLEIRVMAFCDEARGLLSVLETDDEDEPRSGAELASAPSGELPSGSIPQLLAELADYRSLRALLDKDHDWYGPTEQLSVQMMYWAGQLTGHADRILTGLESHASHVSDCRCFELFELLNKRVVPTLRKFDELSNAAERLGRQRRRQP